MTDRQIRELVKKYTAIALKTSSKAGYSPHKLRATAATSLIGRGNSIYDVAALLDHEQVTTTQLYAVSYTHLLVRLPSTTTCGLSPTKYTENLLTTAELPVPLDRLKKLKTELSSSTPFPKDFPPAAQESVC